MRRLLVRLPLLHEVADVLGVRKPDQRVHMVGHEHEADALAREATELCAQGPEDDSFRGVIVE